MQLLSTLTILAAAAPLASAWTLSFYEGKECDGRNVAGRGDDKSVAYLALRYLVSLKAHYDRFFFDHVNRHLNQKPTRRRTHDWLDGYDLSFDSPLMSDLPNVNNINKDTSPWAPFPIEIESTGIARLADPDAETFGKRGSAATTGA
ncbi:uncharacterized protein BDW43DRAFT_306812 [Aspergillus alliaceus]|uniref:uncharacterized protein n=1 Tax=Petromyces alliaceus TaxID=209559 RepID=UPI0012A68B11|nr:uncharacterized protein BDW43DRAFT_306812 [Aspergillus alliaceus]KAB8238117.1 hypothetical protein BDW43DRAFT_306812 [Aspergillus alliaceus]